MRVGLLSDTHGLMRPEALAFLQGCDRIVHAGDIVDPVILDMLADIAPVTAVRGNNDHGACRQHAGPFAVVTVDNLRLLVLHDLADLDVDPAAAGVQVVVCGHSHQPRVERRGEVLFVNPGSCGRRRFKLPVALGDLQVHGATASARIVDLVTGLELARGSLP
jgi:uncharacterized protein